MRINKDSIESILVMLYILTQHLIYMCINVQCVNVMFTDMQVVCSTCTNWNKIQ